ncbi:hypothetical protein CsSME_00002575 [Camellia sinensis var. sinensis]
MVIFVVDMVIMALIVILVEMVLIVVGFRRGSSQGGGSGACDNRKCDHCGSTSHTDHSVG